MALENNTNNDNIKNEIEEALRKAKEELKNYPDIPEHSETIMKHPNMDATGYYSEIDFEVGARLKRCETFLKTKGMLEKALYDNLRNEIATKGEGLRMEVEKLSQGHRILTRAARLCKDPKAKEEILKRAEELKQAPAVKDYNLLITGLEYYAGVHDGKMPGECLDVLENRIGYVTNGLVTHATTVLSERLKEVPGKIKVEMRNMDNFMEQVKESHPAFKEKNEQTKGTLYPTQKMFDKMIGPYTKDAVKDTLDACSKNMEERLDFLIINGMTLREMIEEKTGNKEPDKEQIENLSCEYVAAALKQGGRVEAFVPHMENSTVKIFRPDPIVIEGSKPQERVTLSFWESWMSKLGFYKEKAQKFKEQQNMDKKMEECRNRVRGKLAYKAKDMKQAREDMKVGRKERKVGKAITPEQKKDQIVRSKIVEKYKEDYIKAVRLREINIRQKDKLTYGFYPEEGKLREGVKLVNKNGLSQLFRDRPLYYAAAMMLQKGYTFDQVMDPSQLQDVRAQVGQEFKEKYADMTKEEFDKFHVDCMKTLAEKMPELVEKMSQAIHNKEDLRQNYAKFYPAIVCMNVVQMDHSPTPETIAYCGGEQAYHKIVGQLQQADALYALSKSYDQMYQAFEQVLNGGDISVAESMQLNFCEDLVLQGLNAKEPRLGMELSTDDRSALVNSLSEHPKAVAMQKKINQLDETVIDDLLRNQGSNHLKLQVVKEEKEMISSTTVGSIAEGQKIHANVVINGQKMLDLKDPELENDFSM